MTNQGTLRTFDLNNGKLLRLAPEQAKEVQQDALKTARRDLVNKDQTKRDSAASVIGLLRDRESIPQARKLLKSIEESDRMNAAHLVGVLGDKPSVNALKRLMNDRTSTGSLIIGKGPMLHMYGVQLAAGRALVKLLDREAAPLIEAKLQDANSYMVQHWIGILGQTGVSDRSNKLVGLTHSKDEGIRQAAARALLEDDDGTVARRHLDWARHSDEEIRVRVMRAIARRPRKEDAGLLRIALYDKDYSTALWAMRGLVRLNPPDLLKHLKRVAKPKGHLKKDAIVELARGKDSVATAELLKLLRGIEKDKDGWGTNQIDHVCKALVQARPKGLKDALWIASRYPSKDIQLSALGALAALDDTTALDRVRAFARKGHFLHRAQAIKWLAICRDRQSIPFLKNRLNDEESLIRGTAREALKSIQSG